MTDLTARREAIGTEPTGAEPAIDLRTRTGPGGGPADAAGPAPVDTVPDGPPAPEVPEDDTRDTGPSRARSVLIAVLLGLLALACLEVFLLPVAYRQRQQHRVDEYRDAKADLAVGDAAFVLQVPTIGLDEVVVKGASPVLIRGGPGWRDGSAPPGQGNTVILGHSTRWGYPFGKIEDLAAGASIYLRTRTGEVFVYRVTKVRTVGDGDTKVMDPSGPSRLTLVTSAGGPLDGRRVVVQAGVKGTPPEIPEDQRVKIVPDKDPGPFDERGGGGLLLLLAGIAVVAIGVYGFVELRRRYQMSTVLIVAGPAVALGVVLILFNLDAFLPITY